MSYPIVAFELHNPVKPERGTIIG